MFDSPLETQYVRVYPKTCSYRGCALRLELIGCDLDGESWECQSVFPAPLLELPRGSSVAQGPGHAETDAHHTTGTACPSPVLPQGALPACLSVIWASGWWKKSVCTPSGCFVELLEQVTLTDLQL
jgi:hypothetical protein